MKLAASPETNATKRATSSASPKRRSGICRRILFLNSAEFLAASFISVAVYPGATAFTLTLWGAHYTARARVSWTTPPLAAQ